MGNGAVGAAAGGELQPGRATGGATLTASRGELPQGDGQPPNDGALQVQDAVPHASGSTESDFAITDEDVMNALLEIRRAEPGNTNQMPARACGYDFATNQNEATGIAGILRQMQDQFKRREAEYEKAMLEMKNRLGSMEDQQQALENENTLLRARIQSVTPASYSNTNGKGILDAEQTESKSAAGFESTRLQTVEDTEENDESWLVNHSIRLEKPTSATPGLVSAVPKICGSESGKSVLFRTPEVKAKDEERLEDVARSVGILAAALSPAIKAATEETVSSKVTAHDVTAFDFMETSKSDTMRGEATEVTIHEAWAAKPSATEKEDKRNFYSTCAPDVLLKEFADTITHGDYVLQRRKLVTKLGALGYHSWQGSNKEEATATVERYLKNAIDYSNGMANRRRLTTVKAAIDSLGLATPSATVVLKLMDDNFGAATLVERSREHTAGLQQLTLENGILPSQMVAKTLLGFQRQFGANNHGLVDTSARTHITEMITRQAEYHAFLQPFANKLMDMTFSELSLNEWERQFRVFENQTAFRDGLSRMRAAPQLEYKDKKKPTPREVNLLGGYHPSDLEGDDDNEGTPVTTNAATLQRMAAMAVGLHPNDVNAGKTHEAFLKSLVAYIGGNKGGGGGSSSATDWVEKYGVPGYSAPNDGNREMLHIGNICKAIGVDIPANCPKHPRALVGPNCPCNTFRQVPHDKWYYNKGSEQYKSGKPELMVQPPPGQEKEWVQYHGLGKCKLMRRKAHEHAKATGNTSILEPIDRATTDCITTN